jgi:hypothetical protein
VTRPPNVAVSDSRVSIETGNPKLNEFWTLVKALSRSVTPSLSLSAAALVTTLSLSVT